MQARPPPAASQAALSVGICVRHKLWEGWRSRGAVRHDTSLVAGRRSKRQALSPHCRRGIWGGFGRPGPGQGLGTEPPLPSGGVCAERGPGQRSQSHRRCSGPRRAAWRLEVRMRPRLPAAGCCQAVRRIDRPLSALIPAQLTGYSERSSGLSKTPACSSPVTAIPPIRRSLCTPDNMVEIPYYAAFNNAFTRRRDMMF